MAAKLVNESKSEEIYSLYLRGRDEGDELYYRCKQTYGFYKTHFVDFRELIFKQNLVVFNDGNNQLIVENLSKTNAVNSTLIVRHMAGSKVFMREAIELLERLFAKRNIGKVKLLCFAKELEKDADSLAEIGFVKELGYQVGNAERVHYAYEFRGVNTL